MEEASAMMALVAGLVGLLTVLFLASSRRKLQSTVPTPPATAMPPTGVSRGTFTMAEVGKHTEPDDAWIVVEGKVYDVTNYVDEHPGGAAIMSNLGADNTKGFNGPQHPTSAREILEMWYIGDVKG